MFMWPSKIFIYPYSLLGSLHDEMLNGISMYNSLFRYIARWLCVMLFLTFDHRNTFWKNSHACMIFFLDFWQVFVAPSRWFFGMGCFTYVRACESLVWWAYNVAERNSLYRLYIHIYAFEDNKCKLEDSVSEHIAPEKHIRNLLSLI